MERRRFLRSAAVASALSIAGCSGNSQSESCGPGEDELGDIQNRIGDGTLENGEEYIDVSIKGKVAKITDLDRVILDDGTGKAEIYTSGGYEIKTDKLSIGDCLKGSGNAIADDQGPDERLTIQVSSLEEPNPY